MARKRLGAEQIVTKLRQISRRKYWWLETRSLGRRRLNYSSYNGMASS
jgi:hypothetical protein